METESVDVESTGAVRPRNVKKQSVALAAWNSHKAKLATWQWEAKTNCVESSKRSKEKIDPEEQRKRERKEGLRGPRAKRREPERGDLSPWNGRTLWQGLATVLKAAATAGKAGGAEEGVAAGSLVKWCCLLGVKLPSASTPCQRERRRKALRLRREQLFAAENM